MCHDKTAGPWWHEGCGPRMAHHGPRYCCCDSRGFATNAEKAEMLREYQRQLERELDCVGERIENLKAGRAPREP